MKLIVSDHALERYNQRTCSNKSKFSLYMKTISKYRFINKDGLYLIEGNSIYAVIKNNVIVTVMCIANSRSEYMTEYNVAYSDSKQRKKRIYNG